MLEEFRKFIARGNVVDLAVGVIIGTAFTGIVNSLVKDIIMPPIGMLTGGIDFSNFFVNLSGGRFDSLADAQKAGAATVNYGLFVNTVINFLIIAVVIFFLIRLINRVQRPAEAEPAEAEAPPSRSELLLAEIRDLLKTGR